MTEKEQVEICWNFHISKEKYRLRCLIKVLSNSKEEMNELDKQLLESIWAKQDDDSKMRFRGAIPGQIKDLKSTNLKHDELNSYEP